VQIQKLETVNKELLDALPADVELDLPEVPADAPAEKKLEILEQINEKLTDAVDAPEDQPTKPKFGSGLAVPLRLNNKPGYTFVDEHQVDIDSGEKLKLSPAAVQLHKDALEERRAELAEEFIQKYDQEKEFHGHYAMTREEYEQEMEKEHPVLILPKQPGPAWDDSILYGDAGRLILKASQFNESHPAGMLVDFLVSLGSIIGRGPYFNVSATKHYTNEFMARVGDSSKSRKGTGRDVIDQVLKLVDPKWYSDRVESGFGSGEAIINLIRDASPEPAKLNHRTGKFESVIVPGIDDKRLCIREGELASVFVLAGKHESRADIVLRDGWDGKPLRNIVKGRGKEGFSNSLKCEEPHLSISADTTIHELRQKMPVGADENGFGNRFLYVYVYRVKDCPQGAPTDINWDQEVLQFQEVVKFARGMKHVSMTDRARKWWNNNYARFEREGPDGLAGKMTTRASAHIRRIAMLYALIDLSDQIDVEHFQAAEKLWNYCEESALFIFSGITKEQLRILNWIEHRTTATSSQIREELYHRHQKAAEIKADLGQLVQAGKLAVKNDVYVLSRDIGRLAA
jgi:hypothetical protein